MDHLNNFKLELGQYFDRQSSDFFLFWKGRVGLYAILKSMGISYGDEVIMPGFTCVVVPNAVLYLNAKPIYVDIEKENGFGISQKDFLLKVNSKTKAVIVQNNFGYSPNINFIYEFCKQNNIYLIEDVTHGLGGKGINLKNGLHGDASFFSTQWNKPISTGIGGIVLVNNPHIKKTISCLEEEAFVPSLSEVANLKMIFLFKKYLFFKRFQYFLLKLYRLLSQKGFVIGSSSEKEINSINYPKNYLKKMSSFQARIGKRELKNLDEININRIKIGLLYDKFFKTNFSEFSLYPIKDNIFLVYPILVKDRKNFIKKASLISIKIGDWFNSPLHPVQDNLDLWMYKWDCPNSEFIAKHIVNLPTDISLSEFQKIENFLMHNSNDIIEKW